MPGKDNITRRLIFSFSFLALTYLVFGLFSLYGIRTISGLTRTIYNHPLVVSNTALQSNVAITKMHRDMKDLVLFKSTSRIQQVIAAVDQQEQSVYQYLDTVRDKILGTEGKNLEKETRNLFENWRPIREEVIALVRNGQSEKAAEITIGKGADHVAKLEEKMVALTNYAKSKASTFMNKAETTHLRLNVYSIFFLVVSISVSSLIAIFTLKRTASTENEIQESRQLLVNATDQAPIGMALVKPQGIFHKVNQAFCEMIGYSEKELSAMSYQDITHPDDYDIGANVVRQLIEGKIDKAAIEKRYVQRDGNIIDVSLTTSLLKNAQGLPTYFFTQVQDVTEHKKNEESLRESHEKYKTIVDNIGIGVALISPSMEVLEINDQMRKWFPEHDLEKRPVCYRTFNNPPREEICEDCPTFKTLRDGKVHEDTTVTLRPNKTRNYRVVSSPLINSQGEVTAAIELVEDITDRLNLQAQLIQSQKMESVGRLAGGVAHDYNNISSIIIGFSELALEKVEQSDPLHEDLIEILTAAKRSTDITRQLLAFARQQTIAPKILDLNDTIGSMLKMLRRLIGEDIDLAWLPGADVWPIKIDPSQIDQIMANLFVNARDAIVDVGKVTVETKNISFDENYCADHTGFSPGEYVLLAVSDDGCGIAPDILENIFEPFFTTKGMGEGTGLGLATVYGIVKQNNGFINVYSEQGQGTTVKLYLLRYSGAAVAANLEDILEIPLSCGETVLLVEDDASILKVGKRILGDLGYTVLAANTPNKAVSLAEEHAGEINLLITDVVMPEMNGRELSELLQGLYKNLKILFMSGYTADVIAHRGVLEDGVCFMSKPFSKKDMAVKVREVLDRAENKIDA